MTRAGSAVDQPAGPSAANIVRLRDPSTRQDAAAAKEGAKEEFQDLLSKLKGTNSEGADQAVSQNAQSGQIQPKHARQRAIEARLAKTDGDGSGKIGVGSLATSNLGTGADRTLSGDAAGPDDPRLQMPSEPSCDATAVNAGDSAAPGVSDITAAALTLAPLAGCTGGAAAQQTNTAQPEDPNAAGVAALEASVSGQAPAIKAARAFRGPAEPADERVKRADSTDRILVAANASTDAAPDKGALPLDAGVLKVTVRRSESHFAPALRLATASPLGGAAAEGEATTIGTDATTKVPTNATAIVGTTAGTSTNINAAIQANVVVVAEAPAPASAKLSAAPEAKVPNSDQVGTNSEVKSPEASKVSMAEAKAPQNGKSGAMSEDKTADGSKHGIKTDSKGSEAAAPPIDAAPSANAAPSADAATPGAGNPAAASVPPAQQIAARITAEVPTFMAAARSAAAPAQTGIKPAIKVLQIELQPADLGTVSVRMELKDTGLKLHVEADRSGTADLIRGDEDTLSKLLRSAGYEINPASIRVVEGDRSVTPAQAGQQGAQTGLQASTQSQSGWSGRQERPQHGNANPNGGDAQIATSRNDSHEATKARAGDDLYI